MTQHSNYNAPVHNSIAPVQILYEQGVNVGLGIDNINDLFMLEIGFRYSIYTSKQLQIYQCHISIV